MKRQWLWVSLLLFQVGVVLAGANRQDEHDLIVVDAGSTGSRATLYRYQSAAKLHIEVVSSHTLNPGLQSLVTDPASLATYLTQLLSPLNTNRKTPVIFYATAGMRQVSFNQQHLLYKALTHWFGMQPLYQLVDARTITGKEEGRYGFQAVNYLRSPMSSQAFGVMDFGGASVQLTYQTENSKTIYSYSFLGLGKTSALAHFLNVAACFTRGYPLPDGQLGLGDPSACRKQVAKLVHHVHHVQSSLATVHSPLTPITWYVMGGLRYFSQDSRLHLQTQFTLAEMQRAATMSFCKPSWESLYLQAPSDPYLYESCFSSAYFSAIINSGYRISADTPLHVTVAGQYPSWPLGVVVSYALKHIKAHHS